MIVARLHTFCFQCSSAAAAAASVTVSVTVAVVLRDVGGITGNGGDGATAVVAAEDSLGACAPSDYCCRPRNSRVRLIAAPFQYNNEDKITDDSRHGHRRNTACQ